MHDDVSPYRLVEPPTSSGKALLSRAFEHWCGLHYGYSAEDIASVFEGEANGDAEVATVVASATRLIGELIAAGEIRTFARRFGGGSPERLQSSDWELDDFRPRMARSALDPKAPFTSTAHPTHWIFVELEDFNRIVEDSCADVLPAGRRSPDENRPAIMEQAGRPSEDRHVRMPELERRTGLSRSTIYRRIEAGRFPSQIPMGGNIASWWESEVAEWIAKPR